MAFDDAMRSMLPDLLALLGLPRHRSGRRTQPALPRAAQLFTRMFPALQHAEAVRRAGPTTTGFVRWLVETRSIKAHTEIWWWCARTSRTAPSSCAMRTPSPTSRSLAVMAYAYALSAPRLRAIDEGGAAGRAAGRHIEENMWRAIRWGMSGELIDYERGIASVPAAERVRAELADAAPEVAGARARALSRPPSAGFSLASNSAPR